MVAGRLASLLALVWPSRGRHSGPAAAAAAVPDEADEAGEDEGVSPADLTMFDLPTGRVPPYVLPGDEDGAA